MKKVIIVGSILSFAALLAVTVLCTKEEKPSVRIDRICREHYFDEYDVNQCKIRESLRIIYQHKNDVENEVSKEVG